MTIDATPAVTPDNSRRSFPWPLLLLLIAALAFGAYFRFTGLNWSEGHPLHPDENFLTMVTTAIQPPADLGAYFDSATSKLNPYNNGFGLFVYGNLPIFITRYTADLLDALCQSNPQLCLKTDNLVLPFASYQGIQLLGRGLSGLLDLFTLIFMFLMGKRLFGARVGVLAALLGAATVLQIQQSHFYTADVFATFFSTAAFFFVLRFADSNSWVDAMASGAASGLAIASRINVAPILGIVGLAALATVFRQWRQPKGASLEGAILRVVVAAVVAAIVFRVFMPYAFDGVLKFDQRWSNNMNYIRTLISGEDPGGPPGVQWTDRTPIVFPLINIVFWGMGVPLGLAAWSGWAWAAWQTFIAPFKRHRKSGLINWLSEVAQSRSLLIWVWVTAYFVWQGTQWVKSIRYQLPIYPFLTILAAAGLMALWDWARTRSNRAALKRGLALAATALVVGGTFAWAFAFTEIYRTPTTRVAASRWIYDNVPTALTARVSENGTSRAIQLPFSNNLTFTADGLPIFAPLEIAADSVLETVTINHLSDPAADDAPETLRVAIMERPDAGTPLAQTDLTIDVEQAGARGGAYVFQFEPLPLKAGQIYYVVVQVIDGAPLTARSSTIAVESWDETVPVRLDGLDAFGIYNGVEVQRQWEDDANKLAQLVQWLDQSDYVTMSSNRAYGSMSRQPLRYPLTTEYYRALFNGELGFKLVASVESYATLGPFTFPDQETTQYMNLWPDPTRCPQANVPQCHGQIAINFPPAEEAFSVYDHPRVLVFEKTPDFSAEKANAVLSRVPLRDVLRDISPKAETSAPNGLMLDKDVWANQQASGGTWSELFDRNSLFNQSPLVGAVAWYVLVAVLGWLAFPILFVVAPGLKDRGYGVARIAGVLLVSFAVWIAGSARVMAFSRGSILLAMLALAIVSGLSAWRQRAALRSFWAATRRTVLVEEALFGAAFVFFLFVRLGNPDLWHPVMGGEKPMDFAYLNAVIKSEFFPPYDPWHAGGHITYYYYGFVIIATLVKVLGIVPAVAYNYAIPTLFALTALGAFSAGYNLMCALNRRGAEADRSWGLRPFTVRNPIVVGLIAAVFVTFIGNLGEAQLLSEEISKLGGSEFQSSLPGVQLVVRTVTGLGKMVFEGTPLNFRPEWWYFTPTREIPAPPTEAGPISEFPYFTFLYADLHAHMIALPLTLLLLTLAIGWVKRPPRWTVAGVSALVLGGLIAGALRATNTWDFPTYLLIGGGALLIGALATEPWARLQTWATVLAQAALLVATSLILWLPFSSNYATAYSSAEIWNGSLTPIWAYLNIHLLFLFPIVTLALWEFRVWGWRWWRRVWRWVLGEWRWALALALVAVIAGMGLMWNTGRAVIVVAGPVLLLLGLLLVRPRLAGAQRFWTMIVLGAVALTFVVEVVVLKGDISRMNTTFKFYMQVWVLLGVSAAVALGWLADRLTAWRGWGRAVWEGGMWLLVLASFLYIPLATRGKMLDRYVPDMPPGLDGNAYMTRAVYDDTGSPYELKWDYDVIRWLQDNVTGTPVVAEGNSPLYHWGSRISINTGLPAIIGWDWHQRQQRSVMPGQVIDNRLNDVRDLYSTPIASQARDILATYNVKYIVVGPLERSFYPQVGLSKFDQMVSDGQLRVAYRNDGATVYEVVQ